MSREYKPRQSEHSAQSEIFQWARMHEGRYPCLRWLFAIPNGAKLSYRRNKNGTRWSPEATRLKAEGLRPGVADMFLPYPSGGYCGLFIELKMGDNRPSENQREFAQDVSKLGYLAVTCWGAENAINTLKAYIGIDEDQQERLFY